MGPVTDLATMDLATMDTATSGANLRLVPGEPSPASPRAEVQVWAPPATPRRQFFLSNPENAFKITMYDKLYHQDGPMRNADIKSPCCLPQPADSPPCSAGP